MAKEYRVWISVEEHDLDADTYRDIDIPFGAVALVADEDRAIDIASDTHRIGERIAGV